MANVKKNKGTARHTRRNLIILGTGIFMVVVALTVALALSSGTDVSAKGKPNDNGKNKTLTIVSVTTPATFKGVAPYPTKAQAGQKLVAVTIDFDRDFKNHLRSSEAGEVYLTDGSGKQTYYTVDTGLEQSGGPGKKPARQATFVFMVPQEAKNLTFHYGAQNTELLPNV